MKTIKNIDKKDAFNIMASDREVFSFDTYMNETHNLYYETTSFILGLVDNDEVVFFIVVEEE